ncbi:MAG: RrF2 family transcriptional regulator [Bacilli bacterium]
MKISTKGRYGLLLMVDLGMAMNDHPVSLKSVAERKRLSDHYLEQLIAPLRNAGLVRSVRGAYGGYLLSRPAAQITAGEVLRILEGPVAVVDESGDGLDLFWERLRTSIEEVMDSTTIADLIEMWGKTDGSALMFYI